MNKITVGIFGDSYANAEHGHDEFPEMKYNAWFYHLGNNYEATSYGVGGASNFYSYKEFLNNHHKHNKNVFLISYPGRHPSSEIYLENNPKYDYLGKGPGVDTDKGKRLFPSSANTSDYLIRHSSEYNLTAEALRKLHATRDYYLWLAHDEYDKTVTELLIKEIQSIRPDTIFINLFYERFYKEPKENWGLPLITSVQGPSFLQYVDAMIKGIDYKNDKEFPHEVVSKYFEKRCTCHFSQETTLIVAKHVAQALNTGIWNPTVPESILHSNNNLSYYYHTDKPIDKNSVAGF